MNNTSEYFLDLSQSNGLGRPAISIFLRGCDKEVPCSGCHNMELYNETDNEIYLEELQNVLRDYLEQYASIYGTQNIQVAILGGEPLSRKNRSVTHAISRYIKEMYNTSTVIVYSWRTLEDIEEENLSRFLRYVDYGVLGAFEEENFVPNTIPSSSNQGIYNLKTGFKQRNIIL